VVKGIDLAHPLVVAHPDTRRKLLFCNSAFTTHIVDLSKTESKAILEMLSCTRQTTQSFIVGCSGSQAR
jgi:alpha-ketoglutarate-dependent taurine dioxygenase